MTRRPPSPADAPTIRLALALVVRDEERFLAEHLAYHRALGVAHTFVFADRCVDRTCAIARAAPDVTLLQRDRRDEDAYMSAHQTRCLGEALDRARDAGFDWLLHLDPDEFARGDDPHRVPWSLGHARGTTAERRKRAGLLRMLGRLDDDTEQVILRPLDVVPTPVAPGRPFFRHRHVHVRGRLVRRILDPGAGRVVRYRKRLGHYRGKSVVRLSAPLQPASAHAWGCTEDRDLRTVRRGCHYHYVAVDGDLWHAKHNKFAEFPSHWEKGTPVRFPKQAWKECCPEMTVDQARDYFDRYIALPARRLRRERWRARVVRDDFVAAVLGAF